MLSHWFPGYFPIKDPVLIFALVLVLFLGSPMAMARLRLPGLIGLLLAGAILGPHALGVLARDASFVLLGAVGLVYIMFTVALDVDLSAFRKQGLHSVVFGVLTFCLPQGLGTLVAHYVLGFDWLAAILFASMIASHMMLAYPIARRLGLASHKAVTTTVGGTMITDTASLLVLAVVAGITTGEVSEAFFWRLGVSLVVFVAAILVGLPILGRWFFRRFPEDGPAQFVFVLTSVFLCAALSRLAGLEPIVGAFLAGLAVNRLIPRQSPLMNRLMFTGEAIFIPFFLLSVGMVLDVRVLFGGLETWAVAIGLTLTVVVSKYLAASATSVVLGYKKEESRVIFGLSVVQAAATLASVMVGHRLGLFDDAVVNATLIMILVTCVLGPSVVAKFAPAVAAAAAKDPKEAAEPRGVLVPLSSPEQAEGAMELALLVRGADKKSPVYPAFIAAEGGDVARAMAAGDKILARAVEHGSAADSRVEPIKRVHNDPGRALVRARKELGALHVVVPWDAAPSRGGFSRDDGPPPSAIPAATGTTRMGRVVDELAADPGAHVYVTRLPHPLGTCSRVALLVPPGIVLSPLFSDACQVLARLCRSLGAPVLALSLDEDGPLLRESLGRADLRVELAGYASPRAWLKLMTDHVRAGDLVIVWGARAREAAYSHEYAAFSTQTFSRHPGNDVVLFYPRANVPAPVLALVPESEAPGTVRMGRSGTVVMKKS